MALETLEITIDFNASVSGCHRVGWRDQAVGGAYDTTNEIVCPGIGACTIVFDTQIVNTEGCDGPITIEGYVQPCCEGVTSLAERSAWTSVYTPVVVCNRSEITIDDATVLDITIKDPGVLYDLANGLVFTRQPGDLYAIDAVANIATIGDGVMLAAPLPALLSGGLGYTLGDVLDVIQFPVTTGFTAQIRIITAVGGAGEILPGNYVWQTAGSEYYDESTFTFTGGTGAGADFDIVSIEAGGNNYHRYGAILTTLVTVNGQYSIQPVMTITTVTGLNGDLSAHTIASGGSPWATLQNDCTPAPITITDLTLADTPFAICSNIVPVAAAGYVVTGPTGCCINDDTTATACTTIDFENTIGVGIDIEITECGGAVSVQTIPALSTVSFCVIIDGYNLRNQRGITATDTLVSCT